VIARAPYGFASLPEEVASIGARTVSRGTGDIRTMPSAVLPKTSEAHGLEDIHVAIRHELNHWLCQNGPLAPSLQVLSETHLFRDSTSYP
jgi:hypothetical protein